MFINVPFSIMQYLIEIDGFVMVAKNGKAKFVLAYLVNLAQQKKENLMLPFHIFAKLYRLCAQKKSKAPLLFLFRLI